MQDVQNIKGYDLYKIVPLNNMITISISPIDDDIRFNIMEAIGDPESVIIAPTKNIINNELVKHDINRYDNEPEAIDFSNNENHDSRLNTKW
jgi:hypothetical protein